jgi:hypothetical protein
VLRAGDPTRAVVGALIAALCAGALLTIVLILFGSDISQTNSRISLTVIVLAFTSVTGIAGSNLVRQRSVHAGFGYLTIVVALVAFVAVTVSIWSSSFFDADKKLIGYSLVLAFATGHASFLLRSAREDNRAIKWVRTVTLLPLTALVVMVFIDLSADRSAVGADPFAVAFVLYGLGAVLLPLVRRYSAS